MPGRARGGGGASPGRPARGAGVPVPVPIPPLELLQPQQGLRAHPAAGSVWGEHLGGCFFFSGIRGGGRLREPHLSRRSVGTLSRPCLPAMLPCPPQRLPPPRHPPGTQPRSCRLTSPILRPARRHPGDGLRVRYNGRGRQPRRHAGLLHGRAAAVRLPGAPRAGPAASPGPARHPWAPRPRRLPRRQRRLGVGGLRRRRGLRGREVEALYGRAAQAGTRRHPCVGATAQQRGRPAGEYGQGCVRECVGMNVWVWVGVSGRG